MKTEEEERDNSGFAEYTKMRVTCVLPAAGKGRRLGGNTDKPFIRLGKKPLIAYALAKLNKNRFIDDIIVAVSRDKLAACRKLVKAYGFSKVREVIPGGKTRFHSVRNALMKAGDADFILIHDGARPFLNDSLIRGVLMAAKKFGAAISATPAKQTVKIAGKRGFILKTPQRKLLWEAQTPQGFRKDLILRAYRKAGKSGITDDASLVEKLGREVKIVKGSYRNIKITTPEDLELAKLLIKNGI